MVRMQPKEIKMESLRTSLAWDRTRMPSKGILKHKPNTSQTSPAQHKRHSHKGVSLLVKHPSTDTDDIINLSSYSPITSPVSSNTTTDIQDLLQNLSIDNTIQNPKNPKQITVKAKKLYRLFDECNCYDISTPFTMKYSLSYQRINKIQNNQALITPNDIYFLPLMIVEVVKQHKGDEQNPYENNDFYCNAYWVIYLSYTITHLVFEQMNIDRKERITYEADKTNFDKCNVLEHTHILRHQLSVCEWLVTTIGPNYLKDEVPYQLGPLLIRELKRLYDIIDANNQIWLSHATALLC